MNPAKQAASRAAEDTGLEWTLDSARSLDARDPLRWLRGEFEFPRKLRRPDGRDCVYLVGNSLGLMPKRAREELMGEIEDWSTLAGEAHFEGRHAWFSAHEVFRESGARLVGARAGEVVMMNSLTVNLHLMMVSFYRPTKDRHVIVIEDGAFPSDSYAVSSQAEFHGLDASQSVVRLKPRAGEHTLRTEDIVGWLKANAERVALVMLSGVNYRTGQLFDLATITRAAHGLGLVVGWDLAHAAGNAELNLHGTGDLADGPDFAVWCSYKYLNAGPGALAGCFVHERHARTDRPRFAGWWGNDPATRFAMGAEFVARAGADGWQVSNPPIMALAPLRASLGLFDRVGMKALREKSVRLTGFLEGLLRSRLGAGEKGGRVEILTPGDAGARGAQLSIRVPGHGRELVKALRAAGVVCDFREPDVVRAAPVPMYCGFEDAWDFVEVLRRLIG